MSFEESVTGYGFYCIKRPEITPFYGSRNTLALITTIHTGHGNYIVVVMVTMLNKPLGDVVFLHMVIIGCYGDLYSTSTEVALVEHMRTLFTH